MDCPLCFHKNSVHIGEVFCSNARQPAVRDQVENCVKLIRGKSMDESHWHQTRLSVRLVVNGPARITIPGRKVILPEGSFLLLNNAQRYRISMHSDTESRAMTVAFKKSFAESVYQSLNSSTGWNLDNPFFSKDSELIFHETLYSDKEIVRKLAAVASSLDSGHCSLHSNYFHDFYQDILEMILLHTHEAYKKADDIRNVKPSTRKEVYRRLLIAAEFIQANFQNTITLEHLSRICCLSVPYLKRTFKEVYKVTPHVLITQKRLETARELLTQTDKPVYQVANEVGFEDESSFIRLFHKNTGCTPKIFRQSNKK